MLLIHDTLKNVHFTTVRALGEQNRPRGGSTRVALFLSLAACHVHDVASVASSTGTTGTTAGDSTSASLTSTSTSAVDSTGVEDSTGGPPASCLAIDEVGACPYFSAPTETYATQSFEMSFLEPAEVCPCAQALLGGPLQSILVQHPAGWPSEPATAPVIVFHHGNGQSAEFYDFSALAAAGFVVLNVETGSGGAATFGLLCALELARSEMLVPESSATWGDATDCNAMITGHSVGAESAGNLLAGGLESDVIETLSYLSRPYAIRGGMLLAPELRETSLVGGPVPLLIVPTPTDEDIGPDAITRYDRAPLEVEFSPSELGRAMIYPWGTSHSAFGGHDPVLFTPGRSRGQAIVDGYLPPFAAATVFADPSSRATWWSYLTRESYPPAVLDPELWDDLDPFTIQSPVHCASVNSVDCATTPGCEVSGSDCVQVDCSEVATIDCAATSGCVVSANDECMHLPRLRTAYTSEQGGPGNHQRQPIGEFFENHTVPEHDGALQVVVDDAATVIANIDFTINGAPTGHETSLMLVEWGPLDGGELAIEFPDVDLNDYSHLSLRVGNVLDKTSGEDVACAVASSEAVSFELGLREVVDGQTNSESGFVSTGRIVQNDTAYLASQGVTECRGAQTMTTVRFPLAPFCSGLGSSVANQLILRFPELVDTSRVLIDTIELTRAPLDSLAVCGTLAAAWSCEIDELTVTETACSDEPIVTGGTAACDPGDVSITALDAPLVSPVGESPYHGWYVQTPPGAIVDPEDPSAEELAHVRARCVSACELEYAYDPDVAANCTAPDAFLEPTFAGFDARASHHRFPAAEVQGGGLFEGESLDCDLRTDCCEVFDEGLCANRPARVTDARQGLGRGEEWLYGTDGIITLDGDLATAPVQGTLSGTLGGSLCTDGNDTAPCPVYIGSATAELDAPVTLTLACNGQNVDYELESLDLSLAQPAFGIMSHDFDTWSAMPEGGLVFDAHTVVEGLSFDTVLPIEHGVGFMFEAGWANIPAYGKFEVTLDVPCNGILAEVSATFDVVASSWLGSPPEAEITVPSTVTCPSTVSLTLDTDDAEADVASVRWRVDGVLLDDALTSIAFTQAHELTAIVRDARGATTTVRKSIACL